MNLYDRGNSRSQGRRISRAITTLSKNGFMELLLQRETYEDGEKQTFSGTRALMGAFSVGV